MSTLWSSSRTCLLFPPNPEMEKFGASFDLISPKPCFSPLRPCCLSHRKSFHWSRRGPSQLSILVGVIDYSAILSVKCSFVTLSPAESPVLPVHLSLSQTGQSLGEMHCLSVTVTLCVS